MCNSETTLALMNGWIDQHQHEIIQDIQAFCRIRSVSRRDLGVARAPFGPEMREMLDYALMRAASYGFDTVNHEGYCGSVRMGGGKAAIGIFGHLDVVPEGDSWLYPPFDATHAGDFLIGRGVADNKGACVMGLSLMRMFRELHIELKHSLQLVLGCSEETGMADIRYFAKTQPLPEVSLVPDMVFPVNYAQKGMLRGELTIRKCDGNLLSISGGEVSNMVPPRAQASLSVPHDQAVAAFGRAGLKLGFEFEQTLEGVLIRATGSAAHAATPEQGASAIHMLSGALVRTGLVEGTSLAAMQAIAELSGDMYGERTGIACQDDETGRTTLVVGTVKTREHTLTLSVDARLSIAADLEQVEAALTAYCKQAGFSVEQLAIDKPFYISKHDPRVEALMGVYRELTGDVDAQPYTAGGGTYSRWIQNAITFGPGFSDMPRPDALPEGHGGAHAPDECLHIPSAIRAMKIYAAAILELDAL